MCQLLGMNCNSSATITFAFTGFSARGGKTADHTDGWGIAFYEPSGYRAFHDDQPASESPLADFVSRYPIKSQIVVAHIRKATQGAPALANCHPFQREWLGQHWIFATNGDLGSFEPELRGPYRPVGTTDSERAFCWLMQELQASFADREHPPGWQELAPVVARIAERMASHGNCNFLLSNGQALYAHCSSKLYALQRSHPFTTAKLVDCDMRVDLGALNAPSDRIVVIATEPLTDEERWVPMRSGELQVFVDGTTVWQQVNENTRAFPPMTTHCGRGSLAVASGAAA